MVLSYTLNFCLYDAPEQKPKFKEACAERNAETAIANLNLKVLFAWFSLIALLSESLVQEIHDTNIVRAKSNLLSFIIVLSQRLI